LEVPVLHNETISNSDQLQQIVTGYISLEEFGRKQQVLVIDKTPSNRAVLRDVLQTVGFVVYEVKDGEKIVERCKTVQPDILLMDLPIPARPAREVLQAGLEVKQQKDLAHIPIIALATLVTEERALRQQCLEHGFSDVVGKPYSARKLFETMAAHLPVKLVYGGKKEKVLPEDCIMPLTEVLDELVTLVEVGDIKGISKKIKEICEMDSGRYSVFCSHLRKYFDEFQFTGLLNFIAANRSRELWNPNKTQYS